MHPDNLYHRVRKDIFDLSRRRPGAEDRVYNYKNPTISPFYFGSTFNIWIAASFRNKEKIVESYEPEGLIFNQYALVNNMKSKHFTIDLGCGPGFIYEYAAFILSKMAERFPEIGIDGGIDCAGGFIDGCTYSCSLYAFERITLTTENIAQSIIWILHELMIKPIKRTGKYGREYLECSGLALYHLYNVDKWNADNSDPKDKIIKGISGGKQEYTPEEYEQFVRKISEIELFDSVDFMHYCTSCIKIRDKICALTCIKEDGRVWLEFRVVSEIRDEFEKKLRSCGISIR